MSRDDKTEISLLHFLPNRILARLGIYALIAVILCSKSNLFHMSRPKLGAVQATRKLGAALKVTARCQIRLLESPANDPCHRCIFKVLHSTV